MSKRSVLCPRSQILMLLSAVLSRLNLPGPVVCSLRHVRLAQLKCQPYIYHLACLTSSHSSSGWAAGPRLSITNNRDLSVPHLSLEMANEPISSGLKPATLTLVWVLTGLSCMIVIARIITKVVRASGIVLEDYLMLVSMVSDLHSGLLR